MVVQYKESESAEPSRYASCPDLPCLARTIHISLFQRLVLLQPTIRTPNTLLKSNIILRLHRMAVTFLPPPTTLHLHPQPELPHLPRTSPRRRQISPQLHPRSRPKQSRGSSRQRCAMLASLQPNHQLWRASNATLLPVRVTFSLVGEIEPTNCQIVIERLYERAHQYANLSNRSAAIATDLVLACEEFKIPPESLRPTRAKITRKKKKKGKGARRVSTSVEPFE